MNTNRTVLLEGRGLSKQFHGNTVLDGVDIVCHSHTVLALVGENGAGKSTLMNIISGGLQSDAGTLWLDGEEIRFKNSHAARKRGIAFVHQELSLLADLTVAENIMLGLEPMRGGFINTRALNSRAAEVLRELDYAIDVRRMVCDLTPAEKQITEIAKAWVAKPRILILDEPTSSLNKVESDKLFRFVAKAREDGMSVILITHRMNEIFQVCDEAKVLRDGVVTATEPIGNLTHDILISKMVGREVTNAYPKRCETLREDCRMELVQASVQDFVRDVNLRVPVGCVVGIGGLEGQGQRQLARAIFGIQPFTGGEMRMDGQAVQVKNPAQALKLGIGFVPDDRKLEGLALPLSIEENMTLLGLGEISRSGFLPGKELKRSADAGAALLDIKMASLQQSVMHLSGGNQQKVVFAKWISAAPKLLVLHEPTRGVDITSKLEIYALVRDLAQSGLSVLLFSSDMMELIGMSDIIHVLYGGRIMGSVNGADATEEALMALSSGLSLNREEGA